MLGVGRELHPLLIDQEERGYLRTQRHLALLHRALLMVAAVVEVGGGVLLGEFLGMGRLLSFLSTLLSVPGACFGHLPICVSVC